MTSGSLSIFHIFGRIIFHTAMNTTYVLLLQRDNLVFIDIVSILVLNKMTHPVHRHMNWKSKPMENNTIVLSSVIINLFLSDHI